ncbi:hypothetical protein BN1723_019047, partial [Verticillium longisporum]
ARECSQGGSRP